MQPIVELFIDYTTYITINIPEICQPLSLAANVEVYPLLPHYYDKEVVVIKCIDSGKTFKATCTAGMLTNRPTGYWQHPVIDCSVSVESVGD